MRSSIQRSARRKRWDSAPVENNPHVSIVEAPQRQGRSSAMRFIEGISDRGPVEGDGDNWALDSIRIDAYSPLRRFTGDDRLTLDWRNSRSRYREPRFTAWVRKRISGMPARRVAYKLKAAFKSPTRHPVRAHQYDGSQAFLGLRRSTAETSNRTMFGD